MTDFAATLNEENPMIAEVKAVLEKHVPFKIDTVVIAVVTDKGFMLAFKRTDGRYKVLGIIEEARQRAFETFKEMGE